MSTRAIIALAVLIVCIVVVILHFAKLLPTWEFILLTIGIALVAVNQLRSAGT